MNVAEARVREGRAGTGMSKETDKARELIRAAGARLTSARVRVLAELLKTREALTHLELQRLVEAGSEPIDRVTLYRVLDWLFDSGLAHRVVGPDRVFRFSSSCEGGSTGHFRCVVCARVFGLDRSDGLMEAVAGLLPSGFSGARAELAVAGHCADCAAA